MCLPTALSISIWSRIQSPPISPSVPSTVVQYLLQVCRSPNGYWASPTYLYPGLLRFSVSQNLLTSPESQDVLTSHGIPDHLPSGGGPTTNTDWTSGCLPQRQAGSSAAERRGRAEFRQLLRMVSHSVLTDLVTSSDGSCSQYVRTWRMLAVTSCNHGCWPSRRAAAAAAGRRRHLSKVILASPRPEL